MSRATETAGGAAPRDAGPAGRRLRTAMIHLTVALAAFAGTIAARWLLRH